MQHCRAIRRNSWQEKKGHCLLHSIKMIIGCRQSSQDLLCQATYCEQTQFISWEESRSSSRLRYVIILPCFSKTCLGRLFHLKGVSRCYCLPGASRRRKRGDWKNASSCRVGMFCVSEEQNLQSGASLQPPTSAQLSPGWSHFQEQDGTEGLTPWGAHPRGLCPQLSGQHALQNDRFVSQE